MAFRNLYIANAANLKVHHEQLVVETDATYTIPLEDIISIVLENRHTKLTIYTLSKFAEYNITAYTCDERHMPNGILQSFNQHSRQLSVIKQQIDATQPFKNRMWQQLIRQKLVNQGKCLEFVGKYQCADYLYALAEDVTSGDKENKESVGARYYFKVLYGDKFTREEGLAINSALDYGYAIARGAIARVVASYGLQPSLGIWHKSELNAFNLVDDFIEPLRPMIDLWVAHHQDVLEEALTPENKQGLISILGYDMRIDGARHTLHNVAEKMIKSYITALRDKKVSANLILPELIPLQEHQYE